MYRIVIRVYYLYNINILIILSQNLHEVLRQQDENKRDNENRKGN